MNISFDHLSLPILLLIFAGAAAAVWVAGIYLSKATDVLSERLGLGQALGGLILLAIVTNLPEIAITVSAALHHNLGIAVGNILGGIALQTVVLVVLDTIGLGKAAPLTYRAASLELVLEGILVVAVLALVVMGHQLPPSLFGFGLAPASLLITVLWVAGVYLIGKSRNKLPWQQAGVPPDGQATKQGSAKRKSGQAASEKNQSTTRQALIFVLGAAVTLVGGVALEESGDALAGRIGMSGVLFGATVLAAATSLPEVSTGLASIKLGDYQLAVSDIFGGNAFLPVLFLVATLLSSQPVLPIAQETDIYLTGLAMLLTTIYLYGLIFRPRWQIARMGVDSLLVLQLYGLGIGGLFFITSH